MVLTGRGGSAGVVVKVVPRLLDDRDMLGQVDGLDAGCVACARGEVSRTPRRQGKRRSGCVVDGEGELVEVVFKRV
jgi:hypothetical protein